MSSNREFGSCCDTVRPPRHSRCIYIMSASVNLCPRSSARASASAHLCAHLLDLTECAESVIYPPSASPSTETDEMSFVRIVIRFG